MFYKQLSKIIDVFDSGFINDLDYWLATLPENRTKNITTSLVSSKFGISSSSAKIILKFLFEEKILEKHFIGKCPECDMTIKIITEDELQNFLEYPQTFCSDCFEDVTLSIDDIFVAYRRIKKPDASEEEISKEILKRLKIEDVTENFNIADSLSENLFDLYEIFYNPDESAYKKLKIKFDNLDKKEGKNPTQIGNDLEDLVLDLFQNIKGIDGTTKIHTDTNQLDCTLMSLFKLQLPTIYDYLAPYIICECKNEKKSPTNTYVNKLAGIMSTNEAKLGIIISRQRAGKEPKRAAYDQYLINKKTSTKIILHLCDEDLKNIIENKENLLKYLAFKVLEFTTNATNASFEMFEKSNGNTIC